MRANSMTAVLVGMLLVCSLLITGLTLRYIFSIKDLQRLQAQFLRMNQTLMTVQSLVGACLEYSKKDPAIQPILQQFEIKTQPGTNAPPVAPAP